MLLHMLEYFRSQAKLLDYFLVSFEDLDGVPADGFLRHIALDGFLNVGQGMLNRAAEYVRRFLGLGFLGVLEDRFGAFLAAYVLLSADADDLAAQTLSKSFQIELVAPFVDEVHHVDGHHHRHAKLSKLRSQIKVSFYVGAVDDIQYAVGAVLHKVLSGDPFFQRIGRKRINAGQVLDHEFFVAFVKAFLFLNRDARPVSHVLMRSRQVVEKRRLAAVRISRQCDFYTHIYTFLISGYRPLFFPRSRNLWPDAFRRTPGSFSHPGSK